MAVCPSKSCTTFKEVRPVFKRDEIHPPTTLTVIHFPRYDCVLNI